MDTKQDIKAMSGKQLEELVRQYRLPAFRARQIEKWLHARGAATFDEMTDLPASLRENLEHGYRLTVPEVSLRQISEDGTRKYLIRYEDGTEVETVAMPSVDGAHLTVCFSTQAGCAMGCAFCATGLNGFKRNLTPGEMVDQVRLASQDLGMRVSNVVAMGQGEPFANYDACLAALRFMNSRDILDIGARHITVSTCGLIEGIGRFSNEPEQFTLAVSLHSAIQKTRDSLMPGVIGQPLVELRRALKAYGDTTKRRPTLEYAPIQGVNDDDAHMEALITFCSGMLSHVNLIPFNHVEGSSFMPSSRIKIFERALAQKGIDVSIRNSRGADIDSACGQLRQRRDKK